MVGERGPDGERGLTGLRGAKGAKGAKGDTGDSLTLWIRDHPGTVIYIAIMVTTTVVLQIIQVVAQS